ncbi:MAG: hypothetical protein E8D46_00250 [Nitrospira sp.]|nr:hypothetical protein [Nitrospira sp.]TKB76079.1 MAG: hypothetical protein E8D46_00250 [Nitrospira sp.]
MSSYEDQQYFSDVMIQLGWASSASWDRQDWYLQWTELGKTKFDDFMNHVRTSGHPWTPNQLAFIESSLYYIGVKTRSAREMLISDYMTELSNQRLTVVINWNACRSARIFANGDHELMADFVLSNNMDEVRVYKGDRIGDDWWERIPPHAFSSLV